MIAPSQRETAAEIRLQRVTHAVCQEQMMQVRLDKHMRDAQTENTRLKTMLNYLIRVKNEC